MKLSNIILESRDYAQEEKGLERELEKISGVSRIHVTMGDYAGGRPDDDPLKDLSYGSVNFMVHSEFEDLEWDRLVDFIKAKGYDVQQESNYADEEPGERYWYPSIKWHFKSDKS